MIHIEVEGMKFVPVVDLAENYTKDIDDAQWKTYLNIMRPRLELSNRVAIVCSEDVDCFDQFYGWVSGLHEKYAEAVTEEPLFGTSAIYQFAIDMVNFEAIPFVACMDASAGIAAVIFNPLHAVDMDKFLRKEILGEN